MPLVAPPELPKCGKPPTLCKHYNNLRFVAFGFYCVLTSFFCGFGLFARFYGGFKFVYILFIDSHFLGFLSTEERLAYESERASDHARTAQYNGREVGRGGIGDFSNKSYACPYVLYEFCFQVAVIVVEVSIAAHPESQTPPRNSAIGISDSNKIDLSQTQSCKGSQNITPKSPPNTPPSDDFWNR